MLRDTLPMCIPPFFRHIYTVSAVCGILWEWRVKWWWNFDDWEKFFNFVAAFANAMLFSMRGILVFVIGFVMLAAAVGCGDAHYDARLAAIDSIIEERPDSALAGLRAMGFDAFSRSDDRAYFALLLTEAQYKCYDSIASTDTIDLAVNHFTGNGDREKLTRSLIFKGATLEELNRKVEAMEFYKQAIHIAKPSDFYNIGYSYFRMAELCNKEYDVDSTDLLYHKKALYYFTHSLNTKYELFCLTSIATIYRTKNADSAMHYLHKAINISQKTNDLNSYYYLLSILSGLYYKQADYIKAKQYALMSISNEKVRLENENSYYNIIKSYIKMGLIDSAIIYDEQVKEPKLIEDKVSYYDMKADLFEALNNHKKALLFTKLCNQLVDSLMDSSLQSQIKQAEAKYDKSITELKLAQANKSILCLALIASIAVILLLSTFVVFISNRLRMRKQISEITLLKSEIQNLLISHNNDSLSIHDTQFKQSIECYLSVIKDVSSEKNKDGRIKSDDYIRFRKALFAKVLDNKDFWSNLSLYVDSKYSCALSKLIDHNDLSESDKQLLCLVGSGFSNSSILLLSNYTNDHSVSNRKRILATNLNLQCSIEDYFKQFEK